MRQGAANSPVRASGSGYNRDSSRTNPSLDPPREARVPPEDGGSVTRWIGDLKAGDPAAAQRLWERYFASLVRLAQALSAFDSFCASAAEGRFPRLDDRDDLWHILVALTRRKAADQARRQQRQKRGGGRIAVESELAGDDGRVLLDAIAGPGPTPEFAAELAEECRRRLDDLGDDTLRQVAILRMEGYTNEEVAQRLGLRLRSLSRKVELIRRTWLGEVDA
jgi:DNA-directed RNA polymerase specialized sigma24 family protein